MPPSKPDSQALREALDKVNQNIRALREQSKKLQEDRRREVGDNPCKTLRSGITTQIQEINDKIRIAVQTKQAKLALIRALDDEKGQVRTAKNQSEHRQSVAEIEEEVRKLEYELETTSISSLRREKELVARIRDLEAAKIQARHREQVTLQVAKRTEERGSLLAEVKDLQAEIESHRTAVDNLRQQLDVVREPVEQRTTRNEATRLAGEIQASYQEIKRLKDQFERDMDMWREWEKEDKEKKLKEKEEREKARQERQKLLDEEHAKKQLDERKVKHEIERLRRLNPKEEEISTIDQLLAYLGALDGSQTKEQLAAATVFDPNRASIKPGLVALRKGDDDDWLFMDRTKPKDKPNKKEATDNKKDKRIHLHVAKVHAFQHVGVTPPQVVSQIEDTMKQLREKRAYFETFRKSPQQVDAEMTQEQLL